MSRENAKDLFRKARNCASNLDTGLLDVKIAYNVHDFLNGRGPSSNIRDTIRLK
jgi:hypothetical protein